MRDAVEGWADTRRLVHALLPLRYEGRPLANLLARPIFECLLVQRFDAAWLRRRVLDSLPGRWFLRHRARGIRRALRRWGGAGTLLKTRNDRAVLDGVLPRMRRPPRRLLLSDEPGPGVRLSKLVPGRRHPSLGRATRQLYREALAADPRLAAAFPPESEWLQDILGVAMDTLDACQVFWEESGSPGGITTNHFGFEEIAFGREGRRAGRVIATTQHGYLFFVDLWEPEAFDLFLVWDPQAASLVRRASGGTVTPWTVGHFGALDSFFRVPRVAPTATPTRLLYLTNPMPRGVYEAVHRKVRVLCADPSWEVMWRRHPGESEAAPPLEGPYTSAQTGTAYEWMARSHVVLGYQSGTIAEARLLGLRVACIDPHPESSVAQWCRRFGVPVISPEADLSAALTDLLAAPPPEPVDIPIGEEARDRAAAVLDQVTAGELPPGL